MPMAATCPKCGKPMPDGADVGGICPKCMLEFAFEENGSGLSTRFPSLKEDPPLTGQFGPYRILSVLGRGGMGVVYAAQQIALQRKVALKVLPQNLAKDIEFTARFQREAKAMASLSHRHLVAVYDFGCLDGRFYYAMEHVDGTSLRALLLEGKLTTEHALRLIPQICDALHFAHQSGIVHRDIKPENVLVDREGNAKIADFGLAKIMDPARQTMSLTGTMEVLGTFAYAAPEQLESSRGVDHRADLYSLGVMMFEMLTGGLPKEGCAPPSRYVRIDPRWDAIVMKALERSPERRWQDAAQIKEETTRCTALVVEGRPETPRPSAVVPPARPSAARKKPSSSALRAAVPPSATAATQIRPAAPLRGREFPLAASVLLCAAAIAVGLLVAVLSKGDKKPRQGPTPAVAQIDSEPAIVAPNEPIPEPVAGPPKVPEPIEEPPAPELDPSPIPAEPTPPEVEPAPSSASAAAPATEGAPQPTEPAPAVVPQPDPEPEPDAEREPQPAPQPEPGPEPQPVPQVEPSPAPADDAMSKLGAEFDDTRDLKNWCQLWTEEKRDGNPVEKMELKNGWLTFIPRSAVWYNGHRGPYLYREVRGDFAVTMRVRVSNRRGDGAPEQNFCVGGLLVRWPNPVAPGKGPAAKEQWLLHGIGTTDTPGQFEFEAKGTRNGISKLDPNKHLAEGGEVLLQVVRVGSNLYFLQKQPERGWRVMKRWFDDAVPQTLQIGLATCADPATANALSAEKHNATAIKNGRPDLKVMVDYIRFRTPKAPADMKTIRPPHLWTFPEEKLLSFLGESLAR